MYVLSTDCNVRTYCEQIVNLDVISGIQFQDKVHSPKYLSETENDNDNSDEDRIMISQQNTEMNNIYGFALNGF